MDLKQEDALKVFALYLLVKGLWFRYANGARASFNLASFFEVAQWREHQVMPKLEGLRSLSDITDEEAIEVANINGYTGFSSAGFGKSIIDAFLLINRVFIHRLKKPAETADYLRSRGFDLPTYFLGGKKPSEMGLAILKDNQ